MISFVHRLTSTIGGVPVFLRIERERPALMVATLWLALRARGDGSIIRDGSGRARPSSFCTARADFPSDVGAGMNLRA
jgi:hypothetical protein